MRAVTSSPDSPSVASTRAADAASPILPRQSSGFNTIETLFFKEGDELSTPPPAGSDEAPAAGERRRHQRRLAAWLAVAAAVVVACAVIALWHARGNAEPARTGATAPFTSAPTQARIASSQP